MCQVTRGQRDAFKHRRRGPETMNGKTDGWRQQQQKQSRKNEDRGPKPRGLERPHEESLAELGSSQRQRRPKGCGAEPRAGRQRALALSAGRYAPPGASYLRAWPSGTQTPRTCHGPASSGPAYYGAREGGPGLRWSQWGNSDVCHPPSIRPASGPQPYPGLSPRHTICRWSLGATPHGISPQTFQLRL